MNDNITGSEEGDETYFRMREILYSSVHYYPRIYVRRFWEIMKTPTIEDYKEAIQILMVDYADVWIKTETYEEVNEKLKELGI